MKVNELPSWVYKMRNVGYPTGWLKGRGKKNILHFWKFLTILNLFFTLVIEAESYESGVNVKEEGECNELTHLDINESPEQKLVGIDMSRIISYPGFNAPSKSSVSGFLFVIHTIYSG